MLELKKITKVYKTENYTQHALDKVSVSFRKNEFASILGPSGSGKTTLLNIIGGLDHYDTGELIINEVSTKKYKDRDWDSYRNHRIGFVFQSYNLIPHQSVLSNVELALTLSGVSKKERRKRAKAALNKVGLSKHISKKPSQLSGGQMQRVAIARALVNDPDILLADEPTGALDSETSIQIMEILSSIAKEKLVIMVTHNPDLARDYSNRIIKLKDGKIIDDTNPYDGSDNTSNTYEKEKKKTKKTSMSLKTALSLSLNNLMTKKGRTILTAFAGSIGIIGIALILSLSSGVNNYINNVQKEAMLSYPITIEEESYDLSSMFDISEESTDKSKHSNDAIYSSNTFLERTNQVTSGISKNNLTEFKKYIDNKDSKINKYIGENGVIYSYDTKFKVFSYDKDGKLINSDGTTFNTNSTYNMLDNNMNMGPSNNGIFTELMRSKNKDELISDAVREEYDILYGRLPNKYNEIVLVTDNNNEIPSTVLYNLGLLPSSEYKDILKKLTKSEEVELSTSKIDYEDVINKEFKLLTASDLYIKGSNNLFEYIGDNDGKVQELVNDKALELKVVGIIKQKEESKTRTVNGFVGYTSSLTDWIIEHTNSSDVIKSQDENKDINVINGLKFNVSSDSEKESDALKYLKGLNVSEKAKLCISIFRQAYGDDSNIISGTMNMREEELAKMLDQYLLNPDQNVLLSVYDNYISVGSYEDNMNEFGSVDLDTPSKIEIYADSFEDKDGISDAIDDYNKKALEEDKISYTDYVGLLMSSVTTIVNAISYVLIAFVSISLIVSSIMISIITYISVLERTKEIGILRAIGASKKDVTRVFNAETFIEGLVAGILGIVITILLNIPINSVIESFTDISGISKLPVSGAIVLVIISIILTVIAGLIPSRIASKKDPVESLRSE